MKLKLFLSRLSWPAICLMILLQRSPVVQYLIQLQQSLIPRVQNVWTVAVGAVTVGAYNTVTGASGDIRFRANQGVTTGVVGEELIIVMEVEGGHTPDTWIVPDNDDLPAGMTASFNIGFGIATISGTPTESGNFPLTVQAWQRANMGGDKAPDFLFTLTIDPLITEQPVAQEVDFGGSAQLSVTLGNAEGSAFQWQKQNAENPEQFDDLAGQTEASLSLESVTQGDAGIYRVLVTKGEIQEVSQAVEITVNSAIQQQPGNATADWSGNAELSVVMVEPEGVTFQWQKQNADDPEVFDDIPGQTAATLNLTEVTSEDAGSYRVATTSGENVEISDIAVLTVNASPLQVWLETFFEDPFSEETALDQDPDQDSLINAVEFTFGLNPNAMQKEALVRTTQETIEGVIHAVYIFPPLSEGSTTTVSLESNATPDAAGWITLVNGVDGVIIESTAESYTIKLPAAPRQFNRLRIVENET